MKKAKFWLAEEEEKQSKYRNQFLTKNEFKEFVLVNPFDPLEIDKVEDKDTYLGSINVGFDLGKILLIMAPTNEVTVEANIRSAKITPQGGTEASEILELYKKLEEKRISVVPNEGGDFYSTGEQKSSSKTEEKVWTVKHQPLSLKLMRDVALIKIYNYNLYEKFNLRSSLNLGEIKKAIKVDIQNSESNYIKAIPGSFVPEDFLVIVDDLIKIYGQNAEIDAKSSVDFSVAIDEVYRTLGNEYIKAKAIASHVQGSELDDFETGKAKISGVMKAMQILYILGNGYYLPKILVGKIAEKPQELLFYTLVVDVAIASNEDPDQAYENWITLK